ncbi:MAG: MarR family transcriptional regulator [Deltaproteobacteria bacterium]|nr:MarR family transcriptional regulator [Deltaproteobacteria bacterium]
METKEDLIREISRKLFRILNKHGRLEALPFRFSEDLEITHRELHVIQVIGEAKRINITELGTYFGVTKSAASQMVTKLVKRGFVEKGSAAHSNKELQLTLTPQGREAFRMHEQFHGQHMAEVVERLGGFSLSQIATASVLLEILENVVDDRLAERGQG